MFSEGKKELYDYEIKQRLVFINVSCLNTSGKYTEKEEEKTDTIVHILKEERKKKGGGKTRNYRNEKKGKYEILFYHDIF